jgi:hypothetical protein
LSIAEVAEPMGDEASTLLDTYIHVIHEFRGRKAINKSGRSAERVLGCASR